MPAGGISRAQVGDALLEWIEALDVSDQPVTNIDDLADGRLLLHVMHELSEDNFNDPELVLVMHLLEGLGSHLRGRTGCGAEASKKLRSAVKANQSKPDASSLARLVVWATIENDLPWQPRYVQVLQSLREESQQVMKAIIEEFSSHPSLDDEETAASASKKEASVDFLEPGLDLETRFRALKQQYLALKEEQEAWTEEKASLHKEVQAERDGRRSAEAGGEARRMSAMLGLRNTQQEEAREEMEHKQEQLHAQLSQLRDELRQRDKDVAVLQEEMEALRTLQAGSVDLTVQLRDAKEKADESVRLKRQNKELQARLDAILAQKQAPAEGSPEHLHKQLERSRAELADASKDRDEALKQVVAMQQKLDMVQRQEQDVKSDLASTQAKLKALQGQSEGGAAVGGGSREALGDVTLDELRKLHSQKDQLMERLLAEANRASKAEAELKAQRVDAARVGAQKTEAEEARAELEEKFKKLMETGGSADAKSLQSALALRERELQVYRWRERTDSEAVAAQERFMVTCFHELGLRFHKLQAQQMMLESRLSAMEKTL